MVESRFSIGDNDSSSVSRLVTIGDDLFVIAGPCVLEGRDVSMRIAEELCRVTEATGVGTIFKASFDKANRSSIESYRGPGLEKGLEMLAEVRREFDMPVITDVHEAGQAAAVAEVVDCLQIPAFLCRQTDLLVACAKTNKPVNVKKGQFMSPQEMKNVVDKLEASGNSRIMLTERGTFFGYNRLVNDMTAIKGMQDLGCSVIFDATHSTQQPGGLGNASAGRREMGPVLAKSAVAAGADGLFLEVHPEPAKAMSDAACIMPLDWMMELVETCKKISDAVKDGEK